MTNYRTIDAVGYRLSHKQTHTHEHIATEVHLIVNNGNIALVSQWGNIYIETGRNN